MVDNARWAFSGIGMLDAQMRWGVKYDQDGHAEMGFARAIPRAYPSVSTFVDASNQALGRVSAGPLADTGSIPVPLGAMMGATLRMAVHEFALHMPDAQQAHVLRDDWNDHDMVFAGPEGFLRVFWETWA